MSAHVHEQVKTPKSPKGAKPKNEALAAILNTRGPYYGLVNGQLVEYRGEKLVRFVRHSVSKALQLGRIGLKRRRGD
jgi:hypothetical protein